MPITLLSNIPNTHNDDLAGALRVGGTPVHAWYAHPPATAGRGWRAGAAEDDEVTGGWTHELGRLRAACRGTDVLLSGGWLGPTALVRRALTTGAGARTVHFWGEGPRPRPDLPRPGRLALDAGRAAWLAAPGLDGILAVGAGAAAAYRRRAPGRPVHVFPYVTGVGADEPWRPAERCTVGFAGRLLPRKGLDVVLAALALLPARRRPRLEVLGDGPERAALERRAAELAVDVAWLGERQPVEVAARRASWWLQVVPNRAWEGWGMVVPEALNGGVPVAASAHVQAAVALLRDGWNGTVVPAAVADDPAAWAEVLRTYADPDVVAARSAAARATGAAVGPAPAAAWLVALLDRVAGGDRAPGDFVADAWAGLDPGRPR